MNIAETERLRIRCFDLGDAAFIFELLNEPSWIRFIGDKNIATQDDARRYLENGPIAMYARAGFGLYAVESKATGAPVGMCGLIRRDALEDVDLGFAFLPAYWGKGIAFESASAVMNFGRSALGLRRVVAILSQDNDRSRRLLERLGFHFERTVRLTSDDEELDLYASDA